jgi:peptidyl-prolyl cis-trans isomerase SurA
MRFGLLTGLLSFLITFNILASEKFDGIVAVIGSEIILQSELNAYTLMRLEGLGLNKDSINVSQFKTKFLDELIDGKVLVAHAKKDSTISISNQEIEQRLNNLISMMLQQNNLTIDNLDIELQRQQGMTLSKFKSEGRKNIRDQLYKQKVQQSYLSSIKISRKDVESFFNEYKDSLPLAGESVLLSKLSMKLTPSDSVRQQAFEKIRLIKQRLDNGEKFVDLAKKYSESADAPDGGDLGFISKGSLGEIKFEEKAFSLAAGQTSDPFETRLGFHLINVVERKDQKVHIRQIFIKIAPPEQELQAILNTLDSIRVNCSNKDKFISAVKKFSIDDASKIRNGDIGWLSLLELSSGIRLAVDSLTPGSITKPVKEDNIYSLFRLEDRVKERKLSIENDYSILAEKTMDLMAQKKLIGLVSQWRKDLFIDIRTLN